MGYMEEGKNDNSDTGHGQECKIRKKTIANHSEFLEEDNKECKNKRETKSDSDYIRDKMYPV